MGIEINVERVDDDFSNWTPLGRRVSLYLDGSLLDSSTLKTVTIDEIPNEVGNSYLTPVPGIIGMSWTPLLGLGTHTATVTITRDNGETLEFSWEFQITSDK